MPPLPVTRARLVARQLPRVGRRAAVLLADGDGAPADAALGDRLDVEGGARRDGGVSFGRSSTKERGAAVDRRRPV